MFLIMQVIMAEVYYTHLINPDSAVQTYARLFAVQKLISLAYYWAISQFEDFHLVTKFYCA